MKELLPTIRAARRVSTPLLAIRTTDPAATMAEISAALTPEQTPLLAWDLIRGVQAINLPGGELVKALGDPAKIAKQTANPAEALIWAQGLPGHADDERQAPILFFQNAQRFSDNVAVLQACWNLRDQFKSNFRTLILLASSAWRLPPELTSDVLVLDERLPNEQQLAQIVVDLHVPAGLQPPSEESVRKATDALLGLSMFPAEQITAMSLERELDLPALWERKRQMIEQTPGLSVWRGTETFDSIGGCENVKTFLRAVLAGNEPPRAIVFIDEIEKAMGSSQDTSGVSQEMLGTLLTDMQDTSAAGIICIGPPGCAKSMIAKAAGNTAGIPTIAFDLSGMKASLVGESGARLRAALNVVAAVSQGRALYIATCNSIGILPPELRRRFKFGTFFFDLPDQAERKAIWGLYRTRYALEDAGGIVPPDDGWTGAEIAQCCELAYRLRVSLREAAAYIVPVSRSAGEAIQTLRDLAHGRFISASHPGVYRAGPDGTDQPRRVIAVRPPPKGEVN